jgi:hypothetical protein
MTITTTWQSPCISELASYITLARPRELADRLVAYAAEVR